MEASVHLLRGTIMFLAQGARFSNFEILKYIYSVFQMYLGCNYHVFLCFANVSGMYHGCTVAVIALYVLLMYQKLYPTVGLHSCVPSYSGHHLSGAQPIRASRFWHQQAMGVAPGAWGQPWHGSTRHAFLQAGHAHSSMPCWVLCSRNHSWAGIQMGPLQSRLQT